MLENPDGSLLLDASGYPQTEKAIQLLVEIARNALGQQQALP